MNIVVITGNLTRDTELKYTPSGMAVANMGVAVNKRRKQGEEWVDETSFIDCTAFGKTAERMAEKGTKGVKVCISGELKQDRWEREGKNYSKIIVIVNRVEVPAVQAQVESDSDSPF